MLAKGIFNWLNNELLFINSARMRQRVIEVLWFVCLSVYSRSRRSLHD